MKKKQIVLVTLSLCLVLIVALGSVLIFQKSSDGKPEELVANRNIEKAVFVSKQEEAKPLIYQETVVKRFNYEKYAHKENFFVIDDEVCQLEIRDETAFLVKLHSGEQVFKFSEAGKWPFLEKGGSYGYIEYDVEKKLPTYYSISQDGTILEQIDLKNYQGLINNNYSNEVRQIYRNEQYIYFSTLDVYGDLKIFVYDMDGNLHYASGQIMTNYFAVDSKGDLYHFGYNSLLKVDIEDKSSAFYVNLGNTPIHIQINEEQGLVYCLDSEGVKTFDMQTGEKKALIFEFGVNSSYIVDSNHEVHGFYVNQKGEIYISKIDKYAVPMELAVYQYTPLPVDTTVEKQTITLTMPYYDGFVNRVIKLYEQKHPNEKINYQYMYETAKEYEANEQSAKEQYTFALMTGQVADIVWTGESIINPRNAFQSDLFMDLSDLLKNHEDYEALNHAVLNGIEMKGEIKGVPAFYRPYYLAYDKKLADSLGLEIDVENLTWSEAFDLVDQLEATGENVCLIDKMDGYDRWAILMANMPDVIDLEEQTVDLKEKWFQKLIAQRRESLENPYYMGQSKMLFKQMGVPSGYLDFAVKQRDQMRGGAEGKMVVAPFQGELNSNRRVKLDFMLSISNNTQNKEQASSFLSFLLSEEVQRLTSCEYGLPLNSKAYDGLESIFTLQFNEADGVQKIKENLMTFHNSGDYSMDMTDMGNDLNSVLTQYEKGEINYNKFAKEAEGKIKIKLLE